MPRSFIFTVPSTPRRAHSPNSRAHWGDKARAKKQMKDDWGWSIKGAKNGDSFDRYNPYFDRGTVACRITVFWPPRQSGMDDDNLISCFKGGIDALEEMGLVGNDRQLSLQPVKQERDPEKKGRVLVELEGE